MATKTERAWAAGFWDGEGCATINRSTSGRGTAVCEITQVDRTTLDRFRDIVGGGKVYGPYRSKSFSPSMRPRHHWRWSGMAELLAVEACIGPWLGREKLMQLETIKQTLELEDADRATHVPRAKPRARRQPADLTTKARHAVRRAV